MPWELNLSRLLSAFSLLLDLAEGNNTQHARRMAYISLRIAQEMGLPVDECQDIFYATLFHNMGAIQNRALSPEDPPKGHAHLDISIVRKLPLNDRVARMIRYHDLHWERDSLGPHPDRSIPLGVHIIHLADQVDQRYDFAKPYFEQWQEIRQWVRQHAGTFFERQVAEVFLEVSAFEKFWLDYTFTDMQIILDRMEPGATALIDLTQLERIAEAFALLIDSKSQFASRHSQGVAAISEQLGKAAGFGPDTLTKLRIAGLLHDLGKLAIPNAILDKPTSLTPREYQIVKSHPYYTKVVLNMLDSMHDIAEWAGNHHEKPNGQGYPHGLSQPFSLPERIVAVADLVQALTEERPYRPPMTAGEVLSILDSMAKKGESCPEVLAMARPLIQ